MRLPQIFRQHKRQWVALVTLLVLAPLVATIAVRGFSALQAHGRIFAAASVPQRPVAIIFGAQVYPSGRLSAMLADRVTTGAELYHAGKVQALLLTGDNSEATYNEPEAMRQYALNLGVPDEAITLDYAGFRTYDSCYRAQAIYGVTDAILVTQAFHLPRALFLCEALGVRASGVAADRRVFAPRLTFYWNAREVFATLAAAWDVVVAQPVPALGEPTPIL